MRHHFLSLAVFTLSVAAAGLEATPANKKAFEKVLRPHPADRLKHLRDLPEYVVLGNPSADCCGAAFTHGASYLGPQHAGVRMKVDPKNPLSFVRPGDKDLSPEEQLENFGLLDETLVVWGSEFGRTPGADMRNNKVGDGRDHHPHGFNVVMAGGGTKRGFVHGATDELGFHAVENRHYVTDLHATVLHLMGLDPRRLEVPGRKRLERDFGEVIEGVIA